VRKALMAFAAAVACVLLVGCSLWRAATFRSHDRSYKQETQSSTLKVFDADDCAQSSEAAAAVAAAVGIVASIAESEMASYLAAKQKEFTASYTAQSNVDPYYIQTKKDDKHAYTTVAFHCLNLTRSIQNKDSTGQKTEPAFVWTGRMVPNASGSAWKLKTEAVALRWAAARTSKDSGKVDVSVELKMEVTALNDKGETATTTVADKTLKFPGLKIDATADGRVVAKDMNVESSWFPAVPRSQKEIDQCEALGAGCNGVSSITITASVTETGSGGDAFGTLGKEISDNSKSFNDALSQALGGKSQSSTGGSSKGK
jgi:hypothetical protein